MHTVQKPRSGGRKKLRYVQQGKGEKHTFDMTRPTASTDASYVFSSDATPAARSCSLSVCSFASPTSTMGMYAVRIVILHRRCARIPLQTDCRSLSMCMCANTPVPWPIALRLKNAVNIGTLLVRQFHVTNAWPTRSSFSGTSIFPFSLFPFGSMQYSPKQIRVCDGEYAPRKNNSKFVLSERERDCVCVCVCDVICSVLVHATSGK